MTTLQIALSGERPGSSRMLLYTNLRTNAGFIGFCAEVFSSSSVFFSSYFRICTQVLYKECSASLINIIVHKLVTIYKQKTYAK